MDYRRRLTDCLQAVGCPVDLLHRSQTVPSALAASVSATPATPPPAAIRQMHSCDALMHSTM